MEKNFSVCPHCRAKGKHRVIRPATHKTPLITRSDGSSFHLFLEESNVRRAGIGLFEVVALFRYDLDPAMVRAESTLITLRSSGDDWLPPLEKAADYLAELLASGKDLRKPDAYTHLTRPTIYPG